MNQVSIYPNPTTGKIFIDMSVKKGENIETVEIINTIGKTIKQYTVNNNTISIDISSQTKGIYFVKVTTNKGVAISKVILE